MNIKTAYVEITNRCNLNCATCYNRSGLNCHTIELPLEKIESIITLLLPYGLERFLLSGGEPSLHSQFEDILDLVDRYPQLCFGIVTNGTNHNKKLLHFLNTRNNLTLQISLDGSCEEVNAKTRGVGRFEQALTFAKQIHTPKQPPLLKMVISQNNYTDVENFCKLAFSIGFTPELAFIYKSGNGSQNWNNKCLTPTQKLAVLKLADRMNRERGTSIFLPMCTMSCPFVKGASDLSICIKTDGSIQPCQALYKETYTLGNVLVFDEKLFFQRLNNIIEIAKIRSVQNYGCDKCMLYSVCGRGCMAAAIHLNNDPLSDDEDCEYRKMQFINLTLKGAVARLEKEKN